MKNELYYKREELLLKNDLIIDLKNKVHLQETKILEIPKAHERYLREAKEIVHKMENTVEKKELEWRSKEKGISIFYLYIYLFIYLSILSLSLYL
jgi:hypothetical protein